MVTVDSLVNRMESGLHPGKVLVPQRRAERHLQLVGLADVPHISRVRHAHFRRRNPFLVHSLAAGLVEGGQEGVHG